MAKKTAAPNPERVIEVLDAALELMNDSGAHWTQGTYKSSYPEDDGKYAFCTIGALHEVTGGWDGDERTLEDPVLLAATQALADAYAPDDYATARWQIGDKVINWNDDEDTNWKKVRARFTRAKNRVKRRGAL